MWRSFLADKPFFDEVTSAPRSLHAFSRCPFIFGGCLSESIFLPKIEHLWLEPVLGWTEPRDQMYLQYL